MSESSVISVDFPQPNCGISSAEIRQLVEQFKPVVIPPVEFAQNIGLIAAKRMGKREFTLNTRDRTVPVSFIRHTVAACLRFSFSPQTPWKEIGRIIHRDHTSALYGCYSLAMKLKHCRPDRDLFREIQGDVVCVYPRAYGIEEELIKWALRRNPKGLGA